MSSTRRYSLLKSLLFIAAIGGINFPRAGSDSSGPSDVWIRKMKTFFRRFDFDGDGYISRQDFDDMAVKFVGKEKFDPLKAFSARQTYGLLFSTFISASAIQINVVMTEDLLIKSMKLSKDLVEFRKLIGELVSDFLTFMNVERKGYFSYPEYRRIFDNTGMPNTDFTKAAFDSFDTDGDGWISIGEILDGAIEYMCSEDEDSTGMFGLLF